MADPERLALAAARGREPKACVVRFASGECPGILLEWRPKQQRGGKSQWEGLVIYASWSPAEMAWTVTQKWLHGDLLGPAGRNRPAHL